ncbi:hypothetical protein TrCOL_g5359 [Triparma columacea]|uniref:Uncharacterized protein n=1 Tax=Triparma columacea TaxID=722753 RepID=A0A9W7G653_9STRA|nr:hypothetical protein TrCOL_g5359 [Triparma columacea]
MKLVSFNAQKNINETVTNIDISIDNNSGFEKNRSVFQSNTSYNIKPSSEADTKSFNNFFNYLKSRSKSVHISISPTLSLYLSPTPTPLCFCVVPPSPSPSASSSSPPATVPARVAALRKSTKAQIGFPSTAPSCQSNPHGWFYPPHRVILSHILSSSTSEVVELGSWLGKSTRFISDRAPNAVVYAVDIWSNEFSLADDHYHDATSSETGTGKSRLAQVDTNADILHNQNLYDTFLKTNWDYRLGHRKNGGNGGVVPVRTYTLAGLDLLKSYGVDPSVVYIDADHHYEPAYKDIEKTLQNFPKAVVVGDDWDYEPVRRAARELALKYNRHLYVEQGKCWSYLPHGTVHSDLQPSRDLYTDTIENQVSHQRIYDNVASIIMSKGPEDLAAVTRHINKTTPPLPRNLAGSGPAYKGRSLLMLCAIHNKPQTLDYLGTYFDINYRTKSKMETALHLAAYYGRGVMVKKLLSLGADSKLVNEYNETPVQAAGHSKVEGARECEGIIKGMEERIKGRGEKRCRDGEEEKGREEKRTKG